VSLTCRNVEFGERRQTDELNGEVASEETANVEFRPLKLAADRHPTFNSDEDGGVVLAGPVVGRRDARVVGAVRLLDAVDGQPRAGRPAGCRRQRHPRVGVAAEQLVAAEPRHVRRPPAPRAALEHQRATGDDRLRPVEVTHVRVRCPRRARARTVKPEFHDADTDILATILARMSVSVSALWNAGFNERLHRHICS